MYSKWEVPLCPNKWALGVFALKINTEFTVSQLEGKSAENFIGMYGRLRM
jgi:hypothetical protein